MSGTAKLVLDANSVGSEKWVLALQDLTLRKCRRSAGTFNTDNITLCGSRLMYIPTLSMFFSQNCVPAEI